MSTPVPLHRNRDFMLLWSGSSVSILGSNMSSVAYPLLVLAVTGSARDAGLSGFVALLPQLLLQLPAGVLVDRSNRKRVMICCDLVCGVAIASLVCALLLDKLTLAQILVVGFIEGSFAVCNRLAAGAAVPNVVPSTQLSTALARNETRRRAATMLGQPLGGLLFGIGRALPFLLDAVSYAVSIASLVAIRGEFQVDREPRSGRSRLADLTTGITWLWQHAFVRVTTLLIAGSNLLFQALFLAVIVIAKDHGASSSAIGLMFGIAAVGGVLGSLCAPAIAARVSMKAVVIGANWAWAALVPILLVVHHPLLLGATYAAMAFIGPLWNVAVSAYQIAVTPDQIRGRVLAGASMIGYGAIPIGSLFGGLALSWVGTTGTVLLLVGWMTFLAVSAVVSPSVRRAPELAGAGPADQPVATARS